MSPTARRWNLIRTDLEFSSSVISDRMKECLGSLSIVRIFEFTTVDIVLKFTLILHNPISKIRAESICVQQDIFRKARAYKGMKRLLVNTTIFFVINKKISMKYLRNCLRLTACHQFFHCKDRQLLLRRDLT